jgi:hypothetical protein
LSIVNLAQLRVVQGQPEKVEPLYRRTLAILEQALGCPTRGREDAGGPCQCLRKVGRADEAISLELRAKTFRAKRS